MKRTELIETAPIPGEDADLGLYRHDQDYVIKVLGGQDLMTTRTHGSEEALGELAAKAVAGRSRPRMLVGGLGMGFTLAAALRHLGRDAEVVVAELVPEVVRWNREPLGRYAGHPLNDERVSVHEIDVSIMLKAETKAFDAIMLDVDNGPEALIRGGNNWLYSMAGLTSAHGALKPDGVLAVWAAAPSRPFSRLMRKAGFEVEEVKVRARGRKGSHHHIWMGQAV